MITGRSEDDRLGEGKVKKENNGKDNGWKNVCQSVW